MIPPEHRDPSRLVAGIDPAARPSLLDGLNERQRQAVTHGGGPLLVLAGAGSGKTRVITHRISHLIREDGVQPYRIVAVTFTNKAAAEMRERVERLLGHEGFGSWIGTFHALCLRILRRDGERVGVAKGFTIYDTDDQLAVVKRLLKEETGDHGSPRSFLSKISRAKNALESPSALEKRAFNPDAQLVARIYAGYQEKLRQANAVDFDDLLVKTLELFDHHAEVAHGYAERCEHLLVDEYQDTNRPQYLLIRHLTKVHGNICVVGDEDQSIYRFRGAEIRNILDFEHDYADTCTIRLEQNYRSTGTILRAAGAVIANNTYRKGKTLWTENGGGEKIQLYHAPDDRSEAVWVAQRIRELESRFVFEDFAVLYRTNAQSRLLEEIFRRDRIPYQIVGSVQFYERKEIKDLLGYLKLAANLADDVAFRRVVNVPARGIGNTTMQMVDKVARGMGLPAMESAGHAIEQGLLASRSATRLRSFLDFAADLAQRAGEETPATLLEYILDAVDYEAYLEKTFSDMATERMENVRALVSAAAEYAEETDDPTLAGFLDRLALVAQADEVGQRPGVTLMTIHCAKGLEFPVVFIAGLEENLFPHAMASETDEDLEEERRLCYVAMTRAEERLLVSHAQMRRFQGALIPYRPSRFLEEIPEDLLEPLGSPSSGAFFGDWKVDGRSGGGYASASQSSAVRAAARQRQAPEPPVRRRPGVDPAPADGYAVGAIVHHPRFGEGKILDREGSGKSVKLTIHFGQHGRKKILPAYTQLKVEVSK